MSGTPAPESALAPTAGERVAWMGKNSTKLIIALIVIVIAALVVAFSFSIFGSSSANPGNMATSGIMEQDNSKEGQAILTVDKLLPGDSGTGTVSISNVGDADGVFSLEASNLNSDPADFAGLLTLVITDDADPSNPVYNQPLSDMTSVPLGTWGAGDKHDYTFTVTFAESAGNEFQDATATVDFSWGATQSTS